ncbi:MAG: hypothetical protein LBI70_01235 [Rickettsiales bacterium]|jgi:hypothetical protein|nr:hypothetical protein [Rickettsiales bacterium]
MGNNLDSFEKRSKEDKLLALNPNYAGSLSEGYYGPDGKITTKKAGGKQRLQYLRICPSSPTASNKNLENATDSRQPKHNKIVYGIYDDDGRQQKFIQVNYTRINELLNEGKINSLDDLVSKGAIATVVNDNITYASKEYEENKYMAVGEVPKENEEDFSTLMSYLKKGVKQILQDKMQEEEDGLNKGADEISFLMLLTNLNTVEELKRVRFPYGLNDSRTRYKNIDSLLEFVGINSNNIDNIKSKFITMPLATNDIRHITNIIIDIGKIKECKKKNINVNDAKNERFLFNFDSSGYGYLFGKKFGPLGDHITFINIMLQEGNSCWYHTEASIAVLAKNPHIFKMFRNNVTRSKNFSTGSVFLRGKDWLPNEFETKHLAMLIDIAKKNGIETVNNRPLSEQVIKDEVIRKLEKLSSNSKLLKLYEKRIRALIRAKEKETGSTIDRRNMKKIIEQHREKLSEATKDIDKKHSNNKDLSSILEKIAKLHKLERKLRNLLNSSNVIKNTEKKERFLINLLPEKIKKWLPDWLRYKKNEDRLILKKLKMASKNLGKQKVLKNENFSH